MRCELSNMDLVEVQWSNVFEQGERMQLMRCACRNSYLTGRMTTELIVAGGAAELSLLQRIIRADSHDNDLHAAMIAQAYDRVWERLHCGSWKTVACIWRQAFAYASVLKAMHLFNQQQCVASLRVLDMALMMAGPYAMPQTHALVNAVEQKLDQTTEVCVPFVWSRRNGIDDGDGGYVAD